MVLIGSSKRIKFISVDDGATLNWLFKFASYGIPAIICVYVTTFLLFDFDNFFKLYGAVHFERWVEIYWPKLHNDIVEIESRKKFVFAEIYFETLLTATALFAVLYGASVSLSIIFIFRNGRPIKHSADQVKKWIFLIVIAFVIFSYLLVFGGHWFRESSEFFPQKHR